VPHLKVRANRGRKRSLKEKVKVLARLQADPGAIVRILHAVSI